MTWSKISQMPVNVSAYKVGFADGTEAIRVNVGTQYADLSPEDAGSLGGYLLTHAPDKGAESEQPE
jgi:hypothetical protein